MKKKLLLTIIVIMLSIIAFGTVNASAATSGTCGSNLKWSLDDSGNLKISGYGKMDDYDSYSYAPWKKYNYQIKTITIENGLTRIGDFAFWGLTGIKEIIIPNSVKDIGDTSFASCSYLETITVGSGVENVDYHAFASCKRLKQVNWNARGTGIIGSEPFSSSGSTDGFKVVVGNNVGYIPEGLFSRCTNLKEVIIADSVQTICPSVFYGCTGLTDVTIGAAVTYIGENAFYNCNKLKNINWNAINHPDFTTSPFLSSGSSSGGMNVIIGDNVEHIPKMLFNECLYVSNITIGVNVSTIGNNAFYGCEGLKEIVWKAKNCSSLFRYYESWNYNLPFYNSGSTEGMTVTFTNEVEKIPQWVFYGADKLLSVSFGENVTEIGEYAFYKCIALKTVNIPDNVLSVGRSAFSSCTALEEITVGENVAGNLKLGFYGCNSLKTIYWNAKACNDFTYDGGPFRNIVTDASISVYFGENVEYIPQHLFYNCTWLKSLTLPNSIEHIGKSAFSSCTSLENVSFGDRLKIIDIEAFRRCISLSELQFPDSVEKIDEAAFFDCSSLTKINIPENLTILVGGAFGKCPITNISISNTHERFSVDEYNAVYSKDKTRFYYLPSGKNLEAYSLDDNVTTIGRLAFWHNSKLSSVILPSKIKQIEEYAFADCVLLKNITIPTSLENISRSSFLRCVKLKDVYYYGSEDAWNDISIDSENTELFAAEIHYNTTPANDGSEVSTKTEVSADKKSFTITPINVENGKTVILALYNGEQFVEMQSAIYTGEEIPFTTTKAYTKAKVMVWDDLTSSKPVCNVEELN